MIITVKILKKGLKYWAAATDPKGWTCGVVINEVSKDLKPGQIVSLDAEDIGTKTRWGSTYIYKPSAIVTPELIAHQQALADARKWLGYAEGDAAKGWDHSNAINKTLDLDADAYPEIADRLTALRQKVAENKAANAAAVKAAEEAARKKAAEKKAREKRINEIENKIKKAENYAQNVDPKDLEGEVLLDTFDIYDGGERIITNDRWLWWIQNNGGDGDDWSVTNVYGGPGTPGGIGWRIPRDEALVKELRGLCHARAEQN